MHLVRSALTLALALAALPGPARASVTTSLHLLDDALEAPPTRPAALVAPGSAPRLAVRLAASDSGGGAPESTAGKEAPAAAPAPGSLDFDLLGDAKPPADAPDQQALRTRRKMLTWHQGLGLGLVGLQVATTVVGQLSYDDKFHGTSPANTNRYRISHALLAYSTLGVFAVNGAVALLAPSPLRRLDFDRVMVHRIAMGTAAVGMVAQAVYGIHTAGREGYLDQRRIARTHLVLGYGTLAATLIGVGAIAF
jgi:hypothetical protein